jgi:MFS transporter, ACS family, hexuronate transporter
MSQESLKNWYHKNWRWFVVLTLLFGTFLNYFDRQTLGLAIDPISREFGLDNIQRGNLLAAFIFAYALFHPVIGLITDKIKNIRLFFSLMVIGWGISTVLAGFATSYTQMFWLRVLLGILEAVNFPICLMIIARIFPPGERSLASGIFASGAFLATLVAPPVIVYFANNFSWRYGFYIAGGTDFLWLIPWLLIFRNPEKRSERWKEAVMKNAEESIVTMKEKLHYIKDTYKRVLSAPGFWAVTLIGIGIIPSLYFITQWLPSFFTQGLGVEYDSILAKNLMIIYLMQDAGLWIGGFIVLKLADRGLTIMKARKAVIFSAYVLMMPILLVPYVSSIALVVTILAMFVFGLGAFLGNQHAFKQDIIKTRVASVAALVGFIETGFSAFVIKEIGIITNISMDFSPVFFFIAGMTTFSLLIVIFMIRPVWMKIE